MLYINDLFLRYQDDDMFVERVIKVDAPSDRVIVLNQAINHKLTKRLIIHTWSYQSLCTAIDRGEVTLLDLDPWKEPLHRDSELSDSVLKIREERWKHVQLLGALEPELFLTDKMGTLVSDIAQQYNLSRTYIYTLIRLWFQNGQTKSALTPAFRRSGGKGKRKSAGKAKRGRPHCVGNGIGINVDEKVRDNFAWAVDQYRRNQVRTKKAAFELMLQKRYVATFDLDDMVLVPVLKQWQECPSLEQFYDYMRADCNLAEIERDREGERRANLTHRKNKKSSTLDAFGPGSLYQFDSTVADCTLVSFLNPSKIISQVTIIVGVDVFSRQIVAATVTLEKPSWMTFILAFEHAVVSKVDYCRSLGIFISPENWSAQGLPHAILVDRAPEFTGYNSNLLPEVLGVEILNTAPYRADMKGIVEQFMNILNNRFISSLPGAIPKRHERGDSDYTRNAVLDIKQLREFVTRAVLYYNQTRFVTNYPTSLGMIEDNVVPTPLELWKWGIANRSGLLRHVDVNDIRLQLLPRAKASVTADGIYFNKTLFRSSSPLVQSFLDRAASTRERQAVTVAYNPLLPANQIYLITKTGEMIPCYQQDPANHELFKDRDFWEIEAFREREHKQKLEIEGKRRQEKAKLDAFQRERTQDAKARVSDARQLSGLSHNESKANRKETHRADREAEREEHYEHIVAFGSPNIHSDPAPADTRTDTEQPYEGYISPPDYIEYLRHESEEAE